VPLIEILRKIWSLLLQTSHCKGLSHSNKPVLTSNTSSGVSQKSQGTIPSVKANRDSLVNYRRELLLSLLSSDRDVPEFLKLITLKDVAYKIGLAWESISKDSIQNCWRKFDEYFYGDLLCVFCT
jgi:hypothetical protein